MTEYLGLVAVLVVSMVFCVSGFVWELRHRDRPFGKMSEGWGRDE